MVTNKGKTIAIVGGGISGLSAAYHLQVQINQGKAPVKYVLVEKEKRLGGTILTEAMDGFIIEGGPDCFFTEKRAALELCHKLGLQDRLLMTNEAHHHTFILSKGKLHELPQGFMLLAPTSISSFLKNSLISPLGKLRMAMDLVIPAKRTDAEESLSQFVRRRLGNEVLEKIAEPLVAGVHASNPDTMSLKSTFPRFIELEHQYGSLIRGMMQRRKQFRKSAQRGGKGLPQYTMFVTLKDGLEELINTVAANVDQNAIITGNGVVALEKVHKGPGGTSPKFLMRFADGTSSEVDAVILATPSFKAAAVVETIDRSLAADLASIPYVSTATVSLGYNREDVIHPLDGFGFVIPRMEGRKIMASTWTSMKFTNRAPGGKLLIRCFVGGAHNEQLCLLNEQEIASLARNELREILGIAAEPLFTTVYRWEKSLPQYTIGHEEKIKRIDARVYLHPGLFLCGSSYWGIGISDCIKSGEKAVARLLEFLKCQG